MTTSINGVCQAMPDYAPVPSTSFGRSLNDQGWVPIYNLNLSEDVPGYLEAPDKAMEYPWTHYIGGHLGRLGTRDDLMLHQQYVGDIVASSEAALASVDPTPYFVKYGANVWAAVKGYLDDVTARALNTLLGEVIAWGGAMAPLRHATPAA
jgi:hypothetical protein